MKLMVDVYRCSKREGLYLFVKKKQKLQELPEALLKSLGDTEHAMSILLTPDKKLARVEVGEVLDGLEKNSYFLQMPPNLYE